MMKLLKRRPPRLEGIHHSLQWIEERIEVEQFEGEDREQLIRWIKGMLTRIKEKS